jgi:hypothetical protein
MRNSYIANTHEAAALNSGKQTAVVVRMRVQPPKYGISIRDGYGIIEDPEGNVHSKFKAPYQLGQEVYVRERWGQYEPDPLYYMYAADSPEGAKTHMYGYTVCNVPPWQSPATMPQSAARTKFKVVGVEVVRVRDVSEEQAVWLNIRSITKDGVKYKYGLCGDDGLPFGSGWKWCDFKDGFSDAWQSYIISKFGQQAWDNNEFIWYFKIEKI